MDGYQEKIHLPPVLPVLPAAAAAIVIVVVVVVVRRRCHLRRGLSCSLMIDHDYPAWREITQRDEASCLRVLAALYRFGLTLSVPGPRPRRSSTVAFKIRIQLPSSVATALACRCPPCTQFHSSTYGGVRYDTHDP
jgi:hypothetical protein